VADAPLNGRYFRSGLEVHRPLSASSVNPSKPMSDTEEFQTDSSCNNRVVCSAVFKSGKGSQDLFKGHFSIKLEHLVRLIGRYMQWDVRFFGRCSQSFVSGPQGYFLSK
jgi:hypothetical protein